MLPQTAEYWKKVIDESSELGVVNANNNRELHRYFLESPRGLEKCRAPR